MEQNQDCSVSEQPSSQGIFKYFLFIFLITIFFVGRVLWPFLPVLILAFVMTAIFHPLYSFFAREIPPVLSSIATCIVIFLVVFVPLVFMIGALSREAYNLYLMATNPTTNQYLKELFQNSQLIGQTQELLAKYSITLSTENLNSGLSELGKTLGLFLYEQISSIASNILRFVGNFALMLLVIFFLLIDGEKLIQFIVDLSPLPEDQDRNLMHKFHAMASVVLVVNGISGMIQGILGGAVFAIFGLNSPLLWGFIMAILAFFPIIGIGVVFVPTAIYLFLKGKIATAIFFLIFYLVVSGAVEYLVKPKLVGNKVKMHTLLVFLAVLGGLRVFGILGIIYGPLVITAFLTLTDIYRSNYEIYLRDT